MGVATLTDPALTGRASAAFTSYGPPETLTRAQRVRRFGVDCGEALEWSAGWEPGGEYVKELVVKNVSGKVMKLRYKLPESKYFSMAFPEAIMLMPGLSRTIPVSFRPIKLEEYDDGVQFWNEKGTFVVPIRANIPTVSSFVPENLDFGFCPVKETGVKTFSISNPGEVPVTFCWSCDGPFVLTPRAGAMAPGASVTITARFTPKEASVYVAQCLCTIPEHTTHVMRIGGIGKFPFLSVSHETVDCGGVLTGGLARHEFRLANKSLVYARYAIARREKDVGPVFALSPTSGTVPPDGELTVSVLYSPVVTGTYTREHYDIVTPGGNTATVELVGEAVGPKLELSKSSVNFGDVPIELPRRTVGRQLEIFNRSPVAVPFQLHGVEANGVFGLSCVAGVIPAGLSIFVNLSFSPEESGNYYKRVHVLVRNQAPMLVDVLGSGYTDKRRPMTLGLKNVRDYFARERAGLGLLSPEDLDARAAARREALARGDGVDEDALDPLSEEEERSEGELMGALFCGSSSAQAPLYFEEEYLDFGASSRLRVGEHKTVRLVNRTSGKLSVQWVVPDGYAEGGVRDQAGPVFAVSPAACDVAPHSAASFKIQFRPKSDQQYYCQRLECVAQFKSLRSFRLVTEDNMTPPWTLSVSTLGHTFPPAVEQFIPKPILSHPTLAFPACHVGEVSYQTVSLANEGDTPMMFHALPDPTGVFSVVPPAGVVPKGGMQLLALRFRPKAVAPYERSLPIVLNNNSAAPSHIQLLGAGCKASLHMEHDGRLFLSTTCVGAASKASLKLTNPSRLPVAYEWDLSSRAAAGVLGVSPPAGVLQGRETVEAVWTFSPTEPRPYLLKVPCLVSALGEGGGAGGHEILKQTLTLSGAGSSGQIRAEPERLDFGPVLVGQSRRLQLALINSSAVDLFYHLTFERSAETAMEEQGEGERVACSKPKGLVPARNSVYVSVELVAFTRGTVEYKVYCALAPGEGGGGGGHAQRALLGPPARLGAVCARAEYPLLQFADVRLAGSAQEMLWEHLSLPVANAALCSLLSDAEKQLVSEAGAPPELQLAPVASLFASVDWHLPPGRLGDADTRLKVLVRNKGSLRARWALKYPTEAEMQMPHWVDSGEATEEELKQAMVVDRGLISVSPRSGELGPGEAALLVLTMAHVAMDEYELPLLLVVESGKRILLNVKGRTLGRGEPYLHLPLREVTVGPTPLGLPKPHRHALELPNYSDVPLAYELDTAPLSTLAESNFDWAVLSCPEPRGVIPPGGVARVPIHFHPLEARSYMLSVPLRVGAEGSAVRTTRTLVLRAVGHEPTDCAVPEAHEREREALLPLSQQLKQPEVEQPMRLSIDRCVFGRVPQGALVRQLLVLSNTSGSPCDFEWDTAHPVYGVRASVYPSHGTVAAGKHVCCKVTMIGAGPTESVRCSLACRLEPQWTEEAAAAAAATAAEARAKAEAARSARKSVTVVQPKLRGVYALQAIEDRRQRLASHREGYGVTGEHEPDPEPQRTLLLDLSATFLPPDALRQAGARLTDFFVPRCLPPTAAEMAEFAALTTREPGAPAPPGAVTSFGPAVKAELRETCEALVAQMLVELMSCDDVRHTFEMAPMTPFPWFAQLAHAERGVAPAPVVIKAAGGAIAAAAPAASALARAAAPARAPAGANAALETYLAAAAAEEEALSRVEAEQQRARETEGAAREAAQAEAERVAAVRASAELQELAEYVLEGTLFNLLSEASHGEFSLTVAPRQIIKPHDAVVLRRKA